MHRESSAGRAPAQPAAFTLIELLVVVAVAALLMSILLPALHTAREQGKAVVCESNLRMLSIAVYMYAEDNGGWFPEWGHCHDGGAVRAEYSWLKTMGPQYGQVSKLLRCPADCSSLWNAAVPHATAAEASEVRQTSYGTNYYVTTGGVDNPLYERDGHGYNRLDWIRQPCNTIFFSELAETGEHAVSDHVHVEDWAAHYPNEREEAAKEVALGRHRGKEGYGFIDGHAVLLPFERTFQIQRIDESTSEIEWFFNKYDPTIAR